MCSPPPPRDVGCHAYCLQAMHRVAHSRLIERAERRVALNTFIFDEEPHPVVERRSGARRLFPQQDLHRVRSDAAVDTLTARHINTAIRVLTVRQAICQQTFTGRGRL